MSHPFTRARLVVVLVATFIASLFAVVASPEMAGADTVGGRPAPAVWDVTPVTGALVPVGQVYIAGSAISSTGITSGQVLVDGAEVPSEIKEHTDIAARIVARPTLTAGQHIASVVFTDGDGAEHRRDWRFTVTEVGAERMAGADRVRTAATIARRDRASQAAPAAVLARADEFADALAGTPLAVAVEGPLLLTARDVLSDAAADALRDLVTPGGTVHLLGGSSALSPAVADAVAQLGFNTVRHEGPDRFATAAAVAGELTDDAPAIVASGLSFPDALAVAASAAAAGEPILLTGPDELPAATRDALAGRPAAVIVGGTAVVSAAVEADVAEQVAQVDRIAGADRYETAVRIASARTPEAQDVALASGLGFADALAGSVDAARSGSALLLVLPDRVPAVVAAHLAATSPNAVRVYGGSAAVSDSALASAVAAVEDRGPELTTIDPGYGVEIHNLDQIRLTFDRSLEVPHTSLSVWFDGRELPSSWATGDFDNHLVVTLGALPFEPRLQEPLDLRIVGQVRADGQWRHVDYTYTFRKIAMSRGDAGPTVQELQNRLIELGYWLGTPDANYGSLTVQAIMAFQKYERLPVTGTADRTTQERLAVAERPRGSSTSGYVVEIDKTRQVLMLVRNGVAEWTFNTSTGTEKYYSEDGNSGTANTPTGSFRVCREVNGLREAPLGSLWRPKYFECSRGIAVHGSTSVPSYPASHGCVRLTYAAMDFIWAQNYMPMGTNILVYGRYPGT